MSGNKAVSWVLALVVGVALLYLGGYTKIIAAEFMDDTMSIDLFNKIEVVAVHYLGEEFGQYTEPYGRLVLGGLEVLTGLLVLWPATRMMGAFLSFVITAGAVTSHIAGEFVEGSEFGLAVIMNGQPTYMIFATAALLFICSIVLLMVSGRE